MFNVGVIGVGMGQQHVRSYACIPGVQVLAIADLLAERRKTCAETYKVPNAFMDYRELLAMPEIQAVSVCLPNILHEPVAVEALKAGKHVLLEKPMAKSVADAESILAAVKATGKKMAISVNYRWDMGPESWYLKDLITRGKLGKIYYVRSYSVRRRTFPRGFKTWFSDKKQSGGAALIDMGPHMLDLAMWFAGDYHPINVSGVACNAIMTETDIDDFGTALIRMQSGVTIDLLSTWASYTRPGLGLTILGTEGGAIYDFDQPKGKRVTLFGADGETLLETVPADIRLAVPREATIQEHFVKCIQEDTEPETKPEHGLAVMKIIEAAYRSSETGRDVVIEW